MASTVSPPTNTATRPAVPRRGRPRGAGFRCAVTLANFAPRAPEAMSDAHPVEPGGHRRARSTTASLTSIAALRLQRRASRLRLCALAGAPALPHRYIPQFRRYPRSQRAEKTIRAAGLGTCNPEQLRQPRSSRPGDPPRSRRRPRSRSPPLELEPRRPATAGILAAPGGCLSRGAIAGPRGPQAALGRPVERARALSQRKRVHYKTAMPGGPQPARLFSKDRGLESAVHADCGLGRPGSGRMH